ncbi:MAG: N-methyl-L-tryptophan oxidase [Planctomycetaceae bacterium]
MSAPFDCDVIVWGLGGMGSAAAWRAAAAGARVMGFEQYSPAHDRGSSHGETRIIRKAYFEHPDYVPLLEEAYRLWRELETGLSNPLFHPVGLFLAGPPESEAVQGTLAAGREYQLPLARLTASQARHRFPGFRFDDAFEVVWEQQAGYLEVERCVLAQLDRARSLGADLRFQTPLIGWQADEHGVRVETADGVVRARSLILTAGPWSGPLVPGLTVRRKPVFWFPAPTELRQSRGAGTFFFDLPEGQFYGFPSRDLSGTAAPTFKAAEHSGGEVVNDPAQLDRALQPADLAKMEAFLRKHIPGTRPIPTAHSVCLYTMTIDHHFIIDRHPDHPAVVVGAGFSGHGFKFAPVVGQALAELALREASSLPIGFLGWNRPARRAVAG